MSDKSKKKQLGRKRRHARVRKTVIGTAERPRLAVFRSNRHVVAQVIDDPGIYPVGQQQDLDSPVLQLFEMRARNCLGVAVAENIKNPVLVLRRPGEVIFQGLVLLLPF